MLGRNRFQLAVDGLTLTYLIVRNKYKTILNQSKILNVVDVLVFNGGRCQVGHLWVIDVFLIEFGLRP